MDTALALPRTGYAAPLIGFDTDTEGGATDDVVWWAVFVGLAYAVALAWATYCRISGGYPDISLTWKGFKVACNSTK